jgi:hypothetical protein
MKYKLKVYQMNDIHWWADYTINRAIKNYTDSKIWKDFYEENPELDVKPLTKSQMRKTKYLEESGSMITFEQRLTDNLHEYPGLFATNLEYI